MSTPSIAAPEVSAEDRVLAIATRLTQETHPNRAYTVSMESSLERDLELDSLARVELMFRIGQAFNIELPAEALAEAESPRDILRFLKQTQRAPKYESPPVGTDSGASGTPDNAQTLLDVLEWHVARQPDRVHILLYGDKQSEEPIRYRDLLQAAFGIAAGLTERDLQPRQTVALMLPTGRGYLASFFGVMIAGGIPVPIYPPARLSQVADHLKRHARILSNAGTTLIITVEQAKPVAVMLRAAVPNLRAIVTPEELRAAPMPSHYRPNGGDIAFLQYTSGSTGDPKGVVLTHANVLANIQALGKATQADANDVFVSWLPLYHDMGLISAWLGSLYHAMPLVLMSPLAFLARPASWLEAISRHRGTISGAPNFAYELCVRNISVDASAGFDLSNWRLAFNGAEPVRPATLESFATRFAPCGLRRKALAPVYGLAESSVGLTLPPLERGPLLDVIRRDPFVRENKAIPALDADTDTLSIPSCGLPLSGHEIRIVDATGHQLPERRIGYLEFRGPSATSGYYRNPQGTEKLLRNGWLDSGDFAYMANGELYIAGRVKDLIKRGGRNLYPYDLEAAVGILPGIRKGCVAVFASADPVAGTERLVVMAETREQDAPVRAALRRQINQTAIDVIGTPADDIVLVPPHAVLKTSSGKLRRSANREAYERGEVGKMTGNLSAARWLQTARFMHAAVLAHAALIARQSGALAYGYYAWIVFVMLAVPVGTAIALLQRPAVGRRIAWLGSKAFLFFIRLPVSAKGLERHPQVPHVLVVNHASYLDSILLTAILPPAPGYAYVAKRELPALIRAVLKGLGTLFVERFDATRSAEDLAMMVSALERGERILVFPEGTFRREAGLRPFHAGAFLAAARANVPIVTAGLRGTRDVLRDGTWLPRHGRVDWEIGPVLIPAGSSWVAAASLSARARKEMESLSGEIEFRI